MIRLFCESLNIFPHIQKSALTARKVAKNSLKFTFGGNLVIINFEKNYTNNYFGPFSKIFTIKITV